MGDELMSRKWRNILIGVIVIGAIVAAVLLLPSGPENYYDKYKDTYAAYQKAYADNAQAAGEVTVDVAAFSYNEEKEIALQKAKEEQAQKEADEKARQESLAEEEAEEQGAPLEGFEEPETGEGGEAVSESEPEPEAADGGNEGETADQGEEEAAGEPDESTGSDETEAAEPEADPDEEAAEDPSVPNKLEMTWKVDVPKAGLYSIRVSYELGSEESVERSVLINSESPFDEAKQIEFYKEGKNVSADENGVLTAFCRDDLGDYPSPYAFMFREGENTITFSATDNKRMTVHGITLTIPKGDAAGSDEIISYSSYLEALQGKENPTASVSVPFDAFTVEEGSAEKVSIGEYYQAMAARAAENGEEVDISAYSAAQEAGGNGQGRKGSIPFYTEGILTEDGSVVRWEVNVGQAGLYNIQMDYLTTKSRGIDIERKLMLGRPQGVNAAEAPQDQVPFSGADTLSFSRLWKDKGEVEEDNQGNQRRPSQAEIFGKVQRIKFKDSLGYETEPYAFYFDEGINYITLAALNEPVIVCNLELTPITPYPTYNVYLAEEQAEHPNTAMSEAGRNYSQKVQGESASLRSSPSLYARYDRSSSETEPYDVSRTILNYIGGDPWTHPGEWIQWDFEVPEDGYYNISIKARQMYQRGAMSARTLYIDDEVPFDAMEAITFSYNTSWEMRTLADADGNPYRFFLEKGSHTIRLEVTMGQMGPVLNDVKESIERLNSIYLKILVLTGATPDRFRDYNLAKVYPEAIRRMDRESKRLYKIVDDIVSITGQKSDRAAVAQTLAIQLETFVENNDRITESFSNFKDNITSLGTAM